MMNGNSLEAFLRTAGGAASMGVGVGEGLAQMFGGVPGVSPQEMEQMWKELDQLAQTDPEQYKRFIDKQMSEMKQEIGKEKEAEQKAQTIESEAAFCVKCLVAKKYDEKEVKKRQEAKKAGPSNGEQGIKLFDFSESQIKESFTENLEKNDPLESPILYLNVVYHDKVLPPLNKGRDIADQKNDREWVIIPMVFTEGNSRKNLEGNECIHYDVHINTCVVMKMKEETRAMRSISHFIILKFQEYVDDRFIIHKKSIKFLKKRRYKCAKGTESQRVAPFVLPKEHDQKSFIAVRDKLKKEEEKKQSLAPKKEDIKLKPAAVPQQTESSIKIPGTQPIEEKGGAAPVKKAPVIMEMSKTIPNFEMQTNEDGFTMTFSVEEEESAKAIELDIHDTELKLNSPNYEFKYNFKLKLQCLIDPDTVKAKFNKAKRTLALTFTKKVE